MICRKITGIISLFTYLAADLREVRKVRRGALRTADGSGGVKASEIERKGDSAESSFYLANGTECGQIMEARLLYLRKAIKGENDNEETPQTVFCCAADRSDVLCVDAAAGDGCFCG